MLLDTRGAVEESMGNCPVCRKGFHAQDLEHVLHLVGNDSSQFVRHLTMNYKITGFADEYFSILV